MHILPSPAAAALRLENLNTAGCQNKVEAEPAR